MKEMRSQFISPAAFTNYKEPILVVDAQMQYLFDHTGKRYLDLFGAIATVGVGHCHPRITSVMKE